MEVNTKIITIIEEEKKDTNKKVKTQKEKKKRVETNTWSITNEQLIYDNQVLTLNQLYQDLKEYEINEEFKNKLTNKNKDKYYKTIVSHLKSKISSYKHQDITKNIFNEIEFTNLLDVVSLIYNCKSKCYYCNSNVYILYELVRENKQWSLDRINNDIGHNIGNLVISCLECNLKRRRTNKDDFFFTKNMQVVKL
jgi:hypothetical protein